MKKLLVAVIAAASLVVMQTAMATVAIEISGENLNDNAGNPLTGGALILMVVDTGAGLPSGTYNLLVNALALGSDGTGQSLVNAGYPGVIVWQGTGDESTGAGSVDLAAVITLGLNGVASGQKVGLLWLPDTATGASFASAGYYGTAESASFTVPNEGQSVLYDFTDGGNALAGQLVVPEPSSIMLVLVGLLGGLGLIRRSR